MAGLSFVGLGKEFPELSLKDKDDHEEEDDDDNHDDDEDNDDQEDDEDSDDQNEDEDSEDQDSDAYNDEDEYDDGGEDEEEEDDDDDEYYEVSTMLWLAERYKQPGKATATCNATKSNGVVIRSPATSETADRGLFEKLAPELRSKIWELVLDNEKHIASDHVECNYLGSSSVLMKLNRTLRNETTNMFWHDATMHLKHDLSNCNRSMEAWDTVSTDRQKDIKQVVLTIINLGAATAHNLYETASLFSLVPRLSQLVDLEGDPDGDTFVQQLAQRIPGSSRASGSADSDTAWYMLIPESDTMNVVHRDTVENLRALCQICASLYPRDVQSDEGMELLTSLIEQDEIVWQAAAVVDETLYRTGISLRYDIAMAIHPRYQSVLLSQQG